MYNRIWFTFSLLFEIKTLLLYNVRCMYVCVIAFIEYGARTGNYSFASSHLASSHSEYDTSFVFSVLSRKWESVCDGMQRKKITKENMYMWTRWSIVYVMSLRGPSYIYIHFYIDGHVWSFSVCIQA